MDNVKSRLISVGYKMWRYQHVAGLLLTLIYFLLKASPGNNESLATRPADEPTTIIKNRSHVYDFYRGQLLQRDLAVINSDIALVFYYAPWSKESMDAFREFEAAADVMHEQVSFIAVNCWYIKGTCRGKLQFQDFPHVFLHRRNMKTAVHYGGQLERDYFIHFLNKAIMPVHYISSMQDGERLIKENQLAVLGSFQAKHIDHNKDFQRFVIIATRLLEYNILKIEFGAMFNEEVVKSFYMKPRILYIHNKMSPRDPQEISMKNSTDEIVQYLFGFWKHMVSPDLNFPWNKASYLHESLREGPLLAVFISSPSISERYHYVRKIRQLAVAYYSDEKENHKNHSSIYANCGRCCKTYIFEKYSPPVACSVCLQETHNTKHLCYDVDELITARKKSITLQVMESICKRIVISPDNSHCSQVQVFYGSNHNYVDICCQKKSIFDQNLIESSSKSITAWKNKQLDNLRQKILVENHDVTNHILPDDHDIPESMESSVVHGLSKIMNKTLQFAILDIDHHKALAVNLGINDSYIYKQNGARFGAAILDSKEEKNFVMKSTRFNLEQFIVNYTLGVLPEHLHSAVQVPECLSTNFKPCVPEVTTNTFEDVVLNSKKNVLLVYYLPWCLSCTSISHSYLYISDMLRGSSTLLVARIDVSTNKLPLPFRVPKFPAVILYPANRSSYSVVFPTDQEMNVPNMLSFLLKNLSHHDIKLLLLDICIHAKDYPSIQHAACEKYKIFQRENSS